MENIKVGISIGDINGIGPEVIIKALANENLLNNITPIIYGSSKAISYYKNILNIDFNYVNCSDPSKAQAEKVNILNCWQETVQINPGKQEENGGKYAYISLDRAVNDLVENNIDALVTAPIHKKTMKMANFPHPGHTEFVTEKAGKKTSLMLMCSESMRLGLTTAHMPLSEVASHITQELIEEKILQLYETCRSDFGITKPTIAVLGLNPHAGDEGLLGKEEEEIINPVIIKLKKKGNLVYGPFAADGFFGSGQYKKFDGILSMYHDQGLVGFKALSFGQGINYTAGLPVVRTSPDHGTGYEIAGKSIANASSFINALKLAVDVARYRKEFRALEANSLHRKKQQSRTAEEENK
ncbi:4-hydroxythreonine-4-phosphate dehydrogenase PdxA [Portibacter lacus]|uniref:4-hydroxythreonine-4-phosphate dehydrogenase n=1 Tax=Portibacter lacus TaxID=1099794 RepID=A0AA37WFU3_9BACT|nr:4-hydroxythreonine-4-phosphate dehydrogenase PdxA [Portibacter lacus]GLR18987.1 4-hydroxythreonine-4-phosphate dehydrogenase [Portibacter lacus]